MAQNSKIGWTDTSWNPVVGCTKVSAGCKHCYAERMSARLAAMARSDRRKGRKPGRKANYEWVVDDIGRWNGRVELVPEALDDPYRWRKPRTVFVNSMSDLFHEDVPLDFILRVFEVMRDNPRHKFQILTKRPERIAENLPGDYSAAAYPNVWIGTSVEDQKTADERLGRLVYGAARDRMFVSCEPLLGPIKLMRWLIFVSWVIVGGESGPRFRPMNPHWATAIRDECKLAGVAFFFKQNSAPKPGTIAHPGAWPREMPREMYNS